MRPWARPDLPLLPGRGGDISVWDTASARLVQPVRSGAKATLYVCGITPYDSTHMGHAATYLAFDLLQRAWLDSGCSVEYTQNITDIDDPLLERAAHVGQAWQDIAAREVRRFSDDAASLRLLPPSHWVSVTEHMSGIVEYIERLQAVGSTYLVDEDVYFDVSAAANFGEVSHLGLDEMLAIAAQRGGDPDRAGKRDPLDVLLWRAARPGEPSWPSALGAGRPGWHVECLAIAHDTLGCPISVQGGGSDLTFPHHEYCAAEARAVGDGFATAFVHAGMVAYEGEKMSKSKGNLVFVSELRSAGADPMAIRTALLSHHYRSDWEWTASDLTGAQQRLERWRAALSGQGGADALVVLQELRAALGDDLDAPSALARVDEWASATLAGDDSDPTAPGLVARALDTLLGIAL